MNKSSWVVSPAPFLLTRPTVSRIIWISMATLIPHLIMLMADGDWIALLVILVSTIGALSSQAIVDLCMHREPIQYPSLILYGILTGFLLPSTIHPIIAFGTCFIGFFITRIVYGSPLASWIHPVATSIALAFISQPSLFPSNLVTPDSVRAVGDAFRALKIDQFSLLPIDQGITTVINTYILSPFRIVLPDGYITLFWHSPSTIPAFRYNIFTLGASIVLLSLRIIDWLLPFFFLLTYSLLVYCNSLMPFSLSPSGGDILFACLTGGILFIAFYILPEYGTLPRTRTGKAVSGILAGIIAFALCGPGGTPAGAIFTVLLINCINPVIEYIENRSIASAGDFA